MTRTTWIVIDPIDTLFFRGAESMVAGENHEVESLFPPMPSTIIGAIRTAVMGQNAIAPADYLKNPAQWVEKFPILGQPESPAFELVGPLFYTDTGCPLLPAPAHWFADWSGKKEGWGKSHPVQAAHPLAGNPLGLTGSVSDPIWLRKPVGGDMKPMTGWWITPEAPAAVRQGKGLFFTSSLEGIDSDQAAILPTTALFAREERVGLTLTAERTAKDGHLYSASHVRLRHGVCIVVGVASEHDLGLSREGVLQLGGEQRVCRYHLLDSLDLPDHGSGESQVALSPLIIADLPAELKNCPRASGKLLRMGGWNMAKGFHKPMDAWLPAGTVFFVKSRPTTGQFLTV